METKYFRSYKPSQTNMDHLAKVRANLYSSFEDNLSNRKYTSTFTFIFIDTGEED